MFSSRFPDDLSPNPLTALLELKRGAGEALIDLTESNPTRAGLEFPRDEILRAITKAEALTYDPQPRGLAAARTAIADYHRKRGRNADEGRLHLTSGTSEAYAFLLKLLTDKGDSILVPRPSYPLVELLAAMEGVNIEPYDLSCDEENGWRIDFDSLDRAYSPRCRAVVTINPNNPTGNPLRLDEASRLLQFCGEKGLALISDEVFLDYPLQSSAARPAVSIFDVPTGALAFTLGGFSKTLALPQLKLGWIATSGPAGLVRDSMDRLDLIADTFLTVNTPVQHAAKDLLELACIVQPQIRRRCAGNLLTLVDAAREDTPARCLPAEAGWYAVLDLDNDTPEEELACGLLEEQNVMAHPGYFFDFPEGKHLVLSLLPEEAGFREGITRLFEYLRRTP